MKIGQKMGFFINGQFLNQTLKKMLEYFLDLKDGNNEIENNSDSNY